MGHHSPPKNSTSLSSSGQIAMLSLPWHAYPCTSSRTFSSPSCSPSVSLFPSLWPSLLTCPLSSPSFTPNHFCVSGAMHRNFKGSFWSTSHSPMENGTLLTDRDTGGHVNEGRRSSVGRSFCLTSCFQITTLRLILIMNAHLIAQAYY